MKSKKSRGQRGVALVIVLLMLLVATLLGISSVNTSTYDVIISGNYRASVEAFYAADSGIQDAISRLVGNIENITSTDTQPYSAGWNKNYQSPSAFNNTPPVTSNYALTITHYGDPPMTAPNNQPYYLIRSTGTSGSASKIIEALVYLTPSSGPFKRAITGCGHVEKTSSGVVDSYNSGNGTYASQATNIDPEGYHYAGSNGGVATIYPAGRCGNKETDGIFKIGGDVVHGDVYVTESISYSGGATIYGTIGEMPDPAVDDCILPPPPECDPLDVRALIDSKDPSPGSTPAAYKVTGTVTISSDQNYGNFEIASSSTLNISGDVTLFIDGYFKMGSAAQIVVPTGSKLTVYARDFVDITGGAVVNQSNIPSAVSFFSSAEGKTTTFDLGGSTDFYGTIYAPLSSVRLSGGSNVYGAIIGEWVSVGGSGQGVHFDEALAGGSGGGVGPYQLTFWRRVSN